MGYRRNFDAQKYWNDRPYCSICKIRKVKTGNICYECKKNGNWPTKNADIEAEIPEEEKLIQLFTGELIDRAPITEKVSSIAGYLKDCALATMRAYNLDDIRNLHDVTFIPAKEDFIIKLQEDGIYVNTENAYTLAYKAISRLNELDLLFGSVFVIGQKNKEKDKTKKIYAPLLLIPLETTITKEGVHFKVKDDVVELNTTLFSKLLDNLPEDELEVRLQDIYTNIPVWPFTTTVLQEFIELVKNIFPEAFEYSKDQSWDFIELEDIEASKEKVRAYNTSGIILSPKKEAEGTIIKELMLLSENLLNNTGVDRLFFDTWKVATDENTETFEPAPEPQDTTQWSDLNPLDLSDNKRKIIQAARTSQLSVITGPPGTGKSFTIQGIILDHLLAGKRVLFVSKMDKAVDVVANGIEKMIGPYAVARSGVRKAQRELAAKLEYISGANTPIKKVTQQQIENSKQEYDGLEEEIQRLQDNFTRLLTQEREWSSLQEKIHVLQKQIKNLEAISEVEIKPSEAEKIKNKVRGAEALIRNKGFFIKTWWGEHVLSDIQKRLKVAPGTSVEDLLVLTEMMKDSTERKEIEKEIAKFEELNTLWNSISTLKSNIHKKALQVIQDILLGNLYVILHDPAKRPEIRKLLLALKAANPQQKKVLLDQVSADTLVTAFPFWASTANHLSQFLPLLPGLFDLVIFDEASQCDLASALPALYRGNRVVVVGDPKQLSHVVIMSKSIEQSALVNNKVSPEDRLTYKFSSRSLFDVAEDKVEQRNSFILDEHFRSDPRIISFSSDHFYNGSLRIMTNHPLKTKSQNAIEIRNVDGRRKENSAENPEEVKAIFSAVRELMAFPTEKPLTIGILSPFRDQVDAINKLMPQYITGEEFDRHEMVVGTAHSFQGDEKDVVILSFSLDPDFHHGTLRFLETPNLFNVAITRAKKKLIVYTSVRPNDLPNGLLKTFLEYSSGLVSDTDRADKFDSYFEQDVTESLRAIGMQVWTQYEAAGFKIDLVVGSGDEYIAVECDGPTHFDMEERAPYHDVWRQEILERAGWRFVRISYREWENNRAESIQKIRTALHLDS